DAVCLHGLVVIQRFATSRTHALVGPGALHASASFEAGAHIGVLLVLLAGVPTLRLTLLEVGGVATAEERDLLLRKIQLEDAGRGTRQELAIMTDQHGRRTQPADEGLQTREPGEIEIVRRLVQQE